MYSKSTSSRFVIVGFAIIAACVPVFAAGTDSKTITIAGHVTAAISLEASLLVQDLDIMAGANKTPLVSVTEFSNYKGGYAVTLQSTRGWKLGQTSGTGSETWAYTLYYGPSGGTVPTAAITPTSNSMVLTSQTGVGGKTAGAVNVLYISFATPGANALNADTYNDTLVFTITGS
ncbi:MAG: hypothetical protein WCQ50_01295 [Spirochaetota bacterium]